MSNITNWLRQLPATYRLQEKGEKSAFICCPFHGEDSPSLSINLNEFHAKGIPVGVFRCFGCGESGRWDKLARKTGLPLLEDDYALHPIELPDPFEQNTTSRANDLASLTQENWGLRRIRPVTRSWRHISKKILLQNDVHEGKRHGRRVVIIPVKVNGYLEGAVLGVEKPTPKYPSYLNSDGGWVLESGLLGWEYSLKLMLELKVRTLVLVEGARDALYLQQAGIPALAILGTQAFSTDKLELLYYYTKANKLILLMDGDKAGRKATYDIEEICEDSPFKVTVIKLWHYYLKKGELKKRVREVDYPKYRNVDPATLPKKYLNKLKGYL